MSQRAKTNAAGDPVKRITELEARVLFLEQGLARKDAANDILTMSLAIIGAQLAATAKSKKHRAGLTILMKNIRDLQLCVPRDTDGSPAYLETIASLAPEGHGHDGQDQDGDPGADH